MLWIKENKVIPIKQFNHLLIFALLYRNEVLYNFGQNKFNFVSLQTNIKFNK